MKKHCLKSIILILISLITLSCNDGDTGTALLSLSDSTDNSLSDSTDKMILYRSDGANHMGNIGDRNAINGLCAGFTSEKPSGYSNYVGMISYTTSDLVDISVPTDKEIWSNTTKIADNWNDLFDGNDLPATLRELGVLPNDTDTWWSGSDNLGKIHSSGRHCTDFTDNTNAVQGEYGGANQTNMMWIEQSPMTSCDASRYILCLAY